MLYFLEMLKELKVILGLREFVALFRVIKNTVGKDAIGIDSVIFILNIHVCILSC